MGAQEDRVRFLLAAKYQIFPTATYSQDEELIYTCFSTNIWRGDCDYDSALLLSNASSTFRIDAATFKPGKSVTYFDVYKRLYLVHPKEMLLRSDEDEYYKFRNVLDRHATLVRAGRHLSFELEGRLKDYVRRVKDHRSLMEVGAYKGRKKQRMLDEKKIQRSLEEVLDYLSFAEAMMGDVRGWDDSSESDDDSDDDGERDGRGSSSDSEESSDEAGDKMDIE